MKQDFDQDGISQRQDRLLTTLEGLLELSTTEVKVTLDQTANLIAEVLAADKVDFFFHDPASASLVTLGTSDTPMGRQQRAIGMDRMPFANGGRAVEVFLTGTSFLTGHADQDPDVLVGVKVGLGVKSIIVTVFEAKTLRRGCCTRPPAPRVLLGARSALGSDRSLGWHRDPPRRTRRTAETGGHAARPTPGC